MEAFKFTSWPKSAVPAFPRDRALLRTVIESARGAFGQHIDGLTHVTDSAAILQSTGDKTVYAVKLTSEQAARLGWVAL